MGNYAPVLTTGIILFNVFLFIIITAFASDGTTVGTASNVYESVDEVGDTYDTTTVAKPSFLSRFFIIVHNLPWWMKVFVYFVNAVLIPITILAWVRGL